MSDERVAATTVIHVTAEAAFSGARRPGDACGDRRDGTGTGRVAFADLSISALPAAAGGDQLTATPLTEAAAMVGAPATETWPPARRR